MKLRSGRTITFDRTCGHKCELWCSKTEGCCMCLDKRPDSEDGKYKAFNRSTLDQFTWVSRAHYYCATCKHNYHKKNSGYVTPPSSPVVKPTEAPVADPEIAILKSQLEAKDTLILELQAQQQKLEAKVKELEGTLQQIKEGEELDKFGEEYYDILREAWNIDGDGFYDEFKKYKTMGREAYRRNLAKHIEWFKA